MGHFVDYVRIASDGSPMGTGNTAMYRASLIPTTSYVAGSNIDLSKYSQLVINWGVTKGSLTSAELIVEFSPDNGTTWYQESAGSISGGTETDSVLAHTVTATGNYRLLIKVSDRLCRISVKGTGTLTNSLIQVDVTVGIN